MIKLNPPFDLFARRGGPHGGRNQKIMRRRNRGAAFRALRPLVKLGEECNELGDVIAKLLMWHADDCNWVKQPTDFRDRLHDEVGDVLAALAFCIKRYGLDWSRIAARVRVKAKTFEAWGF